MTMETNCNGRLKSWLTSQRGDQFDAPLYHLPCVTDVPPRPHTTLRGLWLLTLTLPFVCSLGHQVCFPGCHSV